MSKRLTVFVAIVASLGVGACGSLVNPYIQVAGPTAADTAQSYPEDLQAAINQGEKLRTAYYNAKSDQQYLKNGLAATLPLLNAGALFGIATGQAGHSNFPSVVAFGSSAAVTSATLLTNPSREQIWGSGQAAVTCALSTGRRYLITPRDRVDEVFNRNPATVTAWEEVVGHKVAKVATLLTNADPQGTNTDPTFIRTRAALAKAALTQRRSRMAVAALARSRTQIYSAAAMLRGSLENISALVDSQVQSTTYNLGDLQGKLAGIAAMAGQFQSSVGASAAKNPTPAAPAAAPGSNSNVGQIQGLDLAGRNSLNAATRDLNVAVTGLETAVEVVEFDVERLRSPPTDNCLGAGGLYISLETPSPFEIPRDGQAFVLLHVPAASGAPIVDVAGPGDIAHDAVVAAPNYRIHLNAKGAPSGVYRLVVWTGDGGQKKVADFTVLGASASPDGAPGPDAVVQDVPIEPAAPVAWIPDAGWKKVLALGDPQPDNWPAALDAYGSEHPTGAPTKKEDGSPGDALVAIEAQSLGSKAKSDFEFWWISGARLNAVQAKLGVSAGPAFDTATRAAIAQRNAGTGDALTPDLIKHLFADHGYPP